MERFDSFVSSVVGWLSWQLDALIDRFAQMALLIQEQLAKVYVPAALQAPLVDALFIGIWIAGFYYSKGWVRQLMLIETAVLLARVYDVLPRF